MLQKNRKFSILQFFNTYTFFFTFNLIVLIISDFAFYILDLCLNEVNTSFIILFYLIFGCIFIYIYMTKMNHYSTNLFSLLINLILTILFYTVFPHNTFSQQISVILISSIPVTVSIYTINTLHELKQRRDIFNELKNNAKGDDQI